MQHPSDAQIERYLLKQLPGQITGDANEPELAAFEEHVLFCDDCLDVLEREADLIRMLKGGLRLKTERTFAHRH